MLALLEVLESLQEIFANFVHRLDIAEECFLIQTTEPRLLDGRDERLTEFAQQNGQLRVVSLRKERVRWESNNGKARGPPRRI